MELFVFAGLAALVAAALWWADYGGVYAAITAVLGGLVASIASGGTALLYCALLGGSIVALITLIADGRRPRRKDYPFRAALQEASSRAASEEEFLAAIRAAGLRVRRVQRGDGYMPYILVIASSRGGMRKRYAIRVVAQSGHQSFAWDDRIPGIDIQAE